MTINRNGDDVDDEPGDELIEKDRGFKALLIGETGSGKTHALQTIIEGGLDLFVLSTEPGLLEVLGHLKNNPRFHYRYIPPAPVSWDNMIQLAERINMASAQTLANVSDPSKRDYDQFVTLLTIMSNYTDHRGKNFGPVDDWGTDRCLAVDSLTGLALMVMNLVVGYRPVVSPGEWGTAMSQVEHHIQTLCASVPCHLVMTGHVEREYNEVSGLNKIMVAAPGKKLAPKIPRFFSDVILAQREGKKFHWSTADESTELKARNLEIADNLEPSFVPLIENWRAKVETESNAEPDTPAPTKGRKGEA